MYASPPTSMAYAIGVIVLVVLGIVAFGWKRGVIPARGAAVYIGWVCVAGLVSLIGVFARFDARPPPVVALFVGSIGVALYLGLSSIGREVAARVALPVLIAVQAFRLPLELVMGWGAAHGHVPHPLALGGANFDIVTGIAALPVAWAASRGMKRVVWAWSVVGLAALLTIAVVAVLTAPFIRFFGPTELNTWIAFFPFSEVPAALVVFALAGHLIAIRALRSSSDRPRESLPSGA